MARKSAKPAKAKHVKAKAGKGKAKAGHVKTKAVRAKAAAAKRTAAPKPKASKEFRIKVQNMVAYTELGKPVSLEKLLTEVEDTEWQPEQFPGLVYKITNPRASALIFSQGKVVCTGIKSEEDLEAAMKKITARIRKTGIKVPRNYKTRIENIVASTKVNGDLNLDEISFELENSEYEPEQFPGLVYRISEPRVAFLLFRSGRIIVAGAQNMDAIKRALHKLKENLGAIGVKVEPVSDI